MQPDETNRESIHECLEEVLPSTSDLALTTEDRFDGCVLHVGRKGQESRSWISVH